MLARGTFPVGHPFHRTDSLFVRTGEGRFTLCNTTVTAIKNAARIIRETVDNVNSEIGASEASDLHVIPEIAVDDFTVDAYATRSLFFGAGVRISSGIIFAIHDLCSTVVFHKGFLEDFLPRVVENERICYCPSCMGERSYEGWLVDYSWLKVCPGCTPPEWKSLLKATCCSPRLAIMNFLVERCLFWVTAHECGHILLRHHEIRGEETLGESGSWSDSETRHLLEFEADAFATISDLDFRRVTRNLSVAFENSKSDCSCYKGIWPEASDELAKRLLSTVPVIVSMIFLHHSNVETFESPRPIHRIKRNLYLLNESWKEYFGSKSQLSDDNLRDIFAIVVSSVHEEGPREDFTGKWCDRDYDRDNAEYSTAEFELGERFGKVADRIKSAGFTRRKPLNSQEIP